MRPEIGEKFKIRLAGVSEPDPNMGGHDPICFFLVLGNEQQFCNKSKGDSRCWVLFPVKRRIETSPELPLGPA